MRSTAYKKQGAPDLRSLTQQKFRLFICVAPHIKSKGLPIGGPLLNKNLVFYMRSTTYKKQWALDRWSPTQQKLRLFTCVAPHTKCKGLLIDCLLLSKNLGFLHV
jgi:hypothetical protein